MSEKNTSQTSNIFSKIGAGVEGLARTLPADMQMLVESVVQDVINSLDLVTRKDYDLLAERCNQLKDACCYPRSRSQEVREPREKRLASPAMQKPRGRQNT